MLTQSVTVKPDPPRMITRCAWCTAFPVPAGVVVSHGICSFHAAKVEAEFLRAGPINLLKLRDIGS